MNQKKLIVRLFILLVIVILALGGFSYLLINSTPKIQTLTNPSTSTFSISVSGNSLINSKNQQLKLIGVDATGTEDACIQNKGFSWYALTNAAAKAIASWHADAVRVPLNEDCWLGINGAPTAYSGNAYRTQIINWVKFLNANGLYVILDLHWTAPGSLPANQQWPMADANHSILFWQQVATTFKNNHAVIFDLFNEPFMGGQHPTQANWQCWLNGCSYTNICSNHNQHCQPTTYQTAGEQQLINAVRNSGANQPIEISGLDWSNDPCGLYMTGGNNGSCMILKYLPKDPANQLAVSSHLYYTSECHTLNCFNSDQLVVKQKLPVIIDEFGEKDCQVSFINSVMNWADQHAISYLAWSWKTDSVKSAVCIGSSVKTTNGTQMNQELLANYNGTPNTVAPEPLDIKNHFAKTSWYLTAMSSPAAQPIVSQTSVSWAKSHHSLIGGLLIGLAGIILVGWLITEYFRRRFNHKSKVTDDHQLPINDNQPDKS